MRLAAVACVTILCACSHSARNGDADFATLYRKVHASVAFLSMRAPSTNGKSKNELDDAYGTGVVVASGNWGTRILTAQHVIDHAQHLRVRIGDGKQNVVPKIVSQDRDQDLALLEISEVKNVPVPPFGDSRRVEAGETVALVGYPIPDAFEEEGLDRTASIYIGHVASVRDAGTPDAAIELDLPIVPGESGAPVFTSAGTIVGIAESRFDEERAIGFATPTEVIEPFLRAYAGRR